MQVENLDVIIIGAGAAGLMAAGITGAHGKKVLMLEHNEKVGQKIKISGGGRCNFTNIGATPKNYLSQNPHFAISALAKYDQHSFIKLLESYNIAYHEKTLGQLFCDGSSDQIIKMLVSECEKNGVKILTSTTVSDVSHATDFEVATSAGKFKAHSLIVATGGLSIPKLGATDFGYHIARQFGHKIVQTQPGLVPLCVPAVDLEFYKSLSGVSIRSVVKSEKAEFAENVLFTHRGLSGPAILQISSYLNPERSKKFHINLLPDLNLQTIFAQEKNSKMNLSNFLKSVLPNRFVENWCEEHAFTRKIADFKMKELLELAQHLHSFEVNVDGTEGYAKAEVTLGGVDTRELSSKTMMSIRVPNLFFIGEVVDVTGWLGGYNFQWAWASGFAAGSSVA